MRAFWEQLPAGGDDRGEIDVIPVDSRRRGDAEYPAIQARPQVKRDRLRMAADEILRHLIDFLGPEGDVDDRARAEAELAAVVVELPDDLLRHGVGQDGMRRAAVEGPATQRQEQAFLHRRKAREGHGHVLSLSAWC